MYTIIDKKEIVAISDDEDIAKLFFEDYKKDHKDKNIHIKKFSKKELKSIRPDYMDYYLVRYGRGYIQSKFVETEDLISSQYIDDIVMVKDILMRSAIMEDLDNRDMKILSKSIVILNELVEKYKSYIPSVDELEKQKQLYDGYRYYMDNIDNDEL